MNKYLSFSNDNGDPSMLQDAQSVPLISNLAIWNKHLFFFGHSVFTLILMLICMLNEILFSLDMVKSYRN